MKGVENQRYGMGQGVFFFFFVFHSALGKGVMWAFFVSAESFHYLHHSRFVTLRLFSAFLGSILPVQLRKLLFLSSICWLLGALFVSGV